MATVLDGYSGYTNDGESAILADVIKRGIELSISNGDVMGVYQRANINQNGDTTDDRIIALIFSGEIYLHEPKPDCTPEIVSVEKRLQAKERQR